MIPPENIQERLLPPYTPSKYYCVFRIRKSSRLYVSDMCVCFGLVCVFLSECVFSGVCVYVCVKVCVCVTFVYESDV